MKKHKGLLVSTGVIGILLVILALGDLDYNISKTLIHKSSVFGEIFNLFGEWPATLGMLISVTILFGGRHKDIKWKNILGTIISIPMMVVFSAFAAFMPVRYLFEFEDSGIPSWGYIVILILAIGFFVTALLMIKKLGNEKLRSYRKHGILLILLIVLEMVLVNVVKIIWARPRMRSMDDISQFKKWHEIGGPMNSEEFKSFPSGHTANAFVAIAYTMFVPADNQKRLKWVTVIAVIWGACTALSRVILGAHFLSDVVVGGYLTMLIFYILHGVMMKKKHR